MAAAVSTAVTEVRPHRTDRPIHNGREAIAAAREQGKWHGRPPFGFDVGSEGYLTPNKDYETARVILDELDKGASKRGLARSTGVARGTIQKIAKNRERYTSPQITVEERVAKRSDTSS